VLDSNFSTQTSNCVLGFVTRGLHNHIRESATMVEHCTACCTFERLIVDHCMMPVKLLVWLA